MSCPSPQGTGRGPSPNGARREGYARASVAQPRPSAAFPDPSVLPVLFQGHVVAIDVEGDEVVDGFGRAPVVRVGTLRGESITAAPAPPSPLPSGPLSAPRPGQARAPVRPGQARAPAAHPAGETQAQPQAQNGPGAERAGPGQAALPGQPRAHHAPRRDQPWSQERCPRRRPRAPQRAPHRAAPAHPAQTPPLSAPSANQRAERRPQGDDGWKADQ